MKCNAECDKIEVRAEEREEGSRAEDHVIPAVIDGYLTVI